MVATPADIRRLIRIEQPSTRVRYELADHDPPTLAGELRRFLGQLAPSGSQR